MELSKCPDSGSIVNACTETLLKTLFEAIHSRQCGTYFVVTEENKSAQIVIGNGQLLSAGYAGLLADKALLQVLASSEIRFSFSPDLIFPLPQALTEAESEYLLEQLGYDGFILATENRIKRQNEAAQVRQNEVDTESKPREPERVYRGQRIYIEPETCANAARQQRTYRGQRIFNE